MTKNITPKSWQWDSGETGTGGTYNSDEIIIEVLGSGFGTGPTVILFDRFTGQPDGETIDTAADIGIWDDSSPGSHPNRPPVVTFDGRKAVSHNDPALNQGETQFSLAKLDLTGYTYWTEFYKTGVPDGKSFPGAGTTEETFPDVSSFKWTWHYAVTEFGQDGGIDMVGLSQVGFGDFQSAGNNNKGVTRGSFSSAWEWDAWNSIINMHAPESPEDLDGVDGTFNMNMWNANLQYSDIEDPFQCFDDNGGDPLPTPYRFNDLSVLALSSNGPDTNSQLVLTQYYLAAGTTSDEQKYIILANNADLALATNVDVVPPLSWIDTKIRMAITAEEAAANTHYHIMNNQTELASGAL